MWENPNSLDNLHVILVILTFKYNSVEKKINASITETLTFLNFVIALKAHVLKCIRLFIQLFRV